MSKRVSNYSNRMPTDFPREKPPHVDNELTKKILDQVDQEKGIIDE